MKAAYIGILFLLVGCEDQQQKASMPIGGAQASEIVDLARKSLSDPGMDRGRIVAHLLFNALRHGMSQSEAREAVGSAEWIQHCTFTEHNRRGPVLIRQLEGAGDNKKWIGIYMIECYPTDAKEDAKWTVWLGLSGSPAGCQESVSRFFTDDPGSFSACQVDEIAVCCQSPGQDGEKIRYVTRQQDGGIELYLD